MLDEKCGSSACDVLCCVVHVMCCVVHVLFAPFGDADDDTTMTMINRESATNNERRTTTGVFEGGGAIAGHHQTEHETHALRHCKHPRMGCGVFGAPSAKVGRSVGRWLEGGGMVPPMLTFSEFFVRCFAASGKCVLLVPVVRLCLLMPRCTA